MLPASNHANVTAGTDLAPTVTTVWQPCGSPGGYLLLGELAKYVPLSEARFPHWECSEARVLLTARGAPGERVAVTTLRPAGVRYVVIRTEVVIPAGGGTTVEIR